MTKVYIVFERFGDPVVEGHKSRLHSPVNVLKTCRSFSIGLISYLTARAGPLELD